MKIQDVNSLLRCDQYLKNIFCFIPCFYGYELSNLSALINSLLVFFSFCMTSSAVYILNDLVDYRLDILHSCNKNRLIASGRISKTKAAFIALGLCVISFGLSWFITPNTAICMALYIFISLIYCFVGKQIFIFDLLCIVAGFEVRTIAGCVVINHQMTVFLFTEVFLLCSMLVLSKRLAEQTITHSERVTLKSYTSEFCRRYILLLAVLLNVTWIAYTLMGEPVAKMTVFQNVLFILCSYFVLRTSIRYVRLTFDGKLSYHFCSTIYTDRIMLVNTVLFVFANFLILYL